MTTFGRRMHQRREQLGLSQQEISRLTGIPQSRLSEFEGGSRSEMTVSTALKIARVLGVGLDYLVGTFDEEAATPQDAVLVEAAARGSRRRGRPRKIAPLASASS